MTEPELAVVGDSDLGNALRSHEGPVGAARILQDPVILVTAEYRVLPRDPRIIHHDVGLRVPANPVRGSRLQASV